MTYSVIFLWSYFIAEEEIRSHDYKIINEKKTWRVASTHCWKINGELVSIKSKAEQNYIEEITDKKHDFWIGFSNANGARTPVWSDGESLHYKNFNEDAGKEIDEKCYFVSNRDIGLWTAASCLDKKPFICKVPSKFF